MNDQRSIWQEQYPNHIWLVGVRGRLDQSLTPQLDKTLTTLLDNGRYNLIIDLNNINYINSGGLRCLVSAWRRTKAQNGDIVLFGLNDRILEVFTMVGFDKIFHIVDTSLEAQAVFQQE